MKKICCCLMLICLFVSQLALAETAGATGANTLEEVFAASGLELPKRAESMEALGREIREAVGESAEGFRPGTRLFTLLGVLGDYQGLATRFDMPEGDWDKLWFMLNQGLAQYELILRSELHSGETLGVDMQAKIDAGMDNDQCFALDGNVLLTEYDEDGAVTDGDDMYVRFNQKTNEQRVKLPFVDEISGQEALGDSELGQRLGTSFVQDARHWARAIDILYDRIASQPELEPLMRYVFEGAGAPDDYVLTVDQLISACDRLLKDLSCDMDFIDEVSGTALMDVILQLYKESNYSSPDTALMTPIQRKMMLISVMSAAATALDDLNRKDAPGGELRLHNGRVTLSCFESFYDGSSYDDKLDFSYQPAEEGFALRCALTGSGETHQFSWTQKSPLQNRLSYTLRDRYESDGVITLSTDETGFRFDVLANPDSSHPGTIELEARKRQGGYEIHGLTNSGYEQYRLNGQGHAADGMTYGDFEITWADPRRAQYEMPVFNASYRAGHGQLSVNYDLDTGAVNEYFAEIASGRLDASFGEAAFDISMASSYQSEGFELGVSGREADGTWNGDVLLAAIEHSASTPQISGSYTLGQGQLEANLTFMGMVPVMLSADWTDSALSAKLDTGELGQAGEFNLNTDPEHFRLGFSASNYGELVSGLDVTSDVQDGVRHSALRSYGLSDDAPAFTLDSKLDWLSDGWSYDLLLGVMADGDAVLSVALTGEDHYRLDMSSSDPYTLGQQGVVAITMQDGAAVSGSYTLNHRVHVDERKHREPKEPERIHQENDSIAEPENTLGIDPNIEQEPTDPEAPEIEDEPMTEETAAEEAWPEPTVKPVRSFKK